MTRAFRIVKLLFLIAAILLCLAMPVAGLVSTVTGWEGICYGFTDGQHACPWWEYAVTEMFWASFLFIPLLFVAAVVWLVVAVAQFIIARKSASHLKGSGRPLNNKNETGGASPLNQVRRTLFPGDEKE